MFSGLVECVGEIKNCINQNECCEIAISLPLSFDDIAIGESVSVNGVCLTVTRYDEALFYVSVVPETLRITNLKNIKMGDVVNLERALKMNARLGGHYVQGHVDAIGEITEIKNEGDAWLVTISIPELFSKYIVNKGYIALDGMSITVIESEKTKFSVTLIPHTREVTIANQYQVGKKVNLEVDILAKYIEKLMGNVKE